MRKGFVMLIMAHSPHLSSLPLVVLVQLPPYSSNVWHLCWLQSIRNLMHMYWVGLDAASHSLFYALLSSAFVVLGLLTTDRFIPSTPLTSPLLKGVCQLNCFCSVSCLCFFCFPCHLSCLVFGVSSVYLPVLLFLTMHFILINLLTIVHGHQKI